MDRDLQNLLFVIGVIAVIALAFTFGNSRGYRDPCFALTPEECANYDPGVNINN